MKKCRHCGELFTQYNTIQALCVPCAIVKGQKKTVIDRKKALQIDKRYLIEEKDRIKTRREWIQDVQKATNAYIRARDHGKLCISCGKETKAGDHAGHWKPTSTSPELRFSEENIHLQCIQCNLHLHGNVANYRTGLIQRIGLERVEWLESKHPPAKWTIEQLKAIKSEYKSKLKGLNET